MDWHVGPLYAPDIVQGIHPPKSALRGAAGVRPCGRNGSPGRYDVSEHGKDSPRHRVFLVARHRDFDTLYVIDKAWIEAVPPRGTASW